MRRLAAMGGAVLLLAGCSQAASSPDPDSLVECAIGGAADLTPACEVERRVDAGTLFLVVRHPDGSFRRFEVLQDGRGVATADGAETAQVELDGEAIAVAVGADRYRFPATIAPR
jgi:hypothetical protein